MAGPANSLTSILAEMVSLWGCLREVNKTRGKRSLAKWFEESRESELLVVFGEDVAALLGLVLALVGISIAMLTGNPIFDAIGSIAIGILLLIIAVMIGVEVKLQRRISLKRYTKHARIAANVTWFSPHRLFAFCGLSR